jgi:GNAT superfamily N-acetyltransferase
MNIKTVTYHFIKSKDLSKTLGNKVNLTNARINDANRDYIVAIIDDKIIGYAILFDTEKKRWDALKNVYTLSNIEVSENYRNKGVATNIIHKLLDTIKKENKILMRTSPDLMGKLYTFNKISNIAKNKNVPYIPHNLGFIYISLENSGQFTNKTNSSKINLFNYVCSKMIQDPIIKEWDIHKLEDLNDGFHDVLNNIIENLKTIPSKKSLKTKI